MTKKIVMLPLEVPDNDYCWDGHDPCQYFDNYGGYGICSMGIPIPLKTALDVPCPKPKECLNLKEMPKEKGNE